MKLGNIQTQDKAVKNEKLISEERRKKTQTSQ